MKSYTALFLYFTALLSSWDASSAFSSYNTAFVQRTRIPSAATASPVVLSSNGNHWPTADDIEKELPRNLEELKQLEAELKKKLDDIKSEKRSALASRPLNIGVVGFGGFGQFISKSFAKYGNVVATSRSDYSDIANEMGVKFVGTNEELMASDLDVLVFATSILSFEETVEKFVPHLENDFARRGKAPLIVDVCSVKEQPRQVLLNHLPKECDILATHPMFGPISGANGWDNLNFVFEKTRINGVVIDQENKEEDIARATRAAQKDCDDEDSDHMERFLSIWEEEGCNMLHMSCREHDRYASKSQFITHLMGRILGSQGLSETPIDTNGFKSVLKLIDSTTADSFDLFYGLYKYNSNSRDTILNLKSAMQNVLNDLSLKEQEEQQALEAKRLEKEAKKAFDIRDMLRSTQVKERPRTPALPTPFQIAMRP